MITTFQVICFVTAVIGEPGMSVGRWLFYIDAEHRLLSGFYIQAYTAECCACTCECRGRTSRIRGDDKCRHIPQLTDSVNIHELSVLRGGS